MRTPPRTLAEHDPHSIGSQLARLDAADRFIESRIVGRLVVTHPEVIAEALDAEEARTHRPPQHPTTTQGATP